MVKMSLQDRVEASHAKLIDELYEARVRAGMTQRELSEAAGLSKNHLSALERHENSPTLRVLLALTEAIGVSLGDLV